MTSDPESGPESAVDPYEACLWVIQKGRDEVTRSNLQRAGQLFEVAVQLTRQMTPEQARDLAPLALCWLSVVKQKEGGAGDAAKIREKAMPLVDMVSIGDQKVAFHNLMSLVLMDLHEYRRAIPFIERAVQRVVEWNEPLAIVDLLSREGRCYASCGLKEHAAVLQRAALKILRGYPGDPRLASVLISLGNALRKSAPDEAERLYKEAAEFHVAKAQLESAAPAWVNLGVLCSEQGRHAESLAYYEKALHVREQSRGTPLARIGSLLNNMANCYRRMGNFTEALRLVDRATGTLKPEDGSLLASAYGTRGQIHDDAGQDAEAVEWLQKSYVERERASSPNLDAMAENLAREIAVLKRMGREQDATAAEGRLARVEAEKKNAPEAKLNLGVLKAEAEGAVQIELAFGRGGRYGIRDTETVAEQIGAILADKDAGAYGGRVVIPESTTLMFYGPDAEMMFETMEQYLKDHLICAGAIVAVRQGSRFREVAIPQALN